MLCDADKVDLALQGDQSDSFMKQLCVSSVLCASMFDSASRDLTFGEYATELQAKLKTWDARKEISDEMLQGYWKLAADLESKLQSQVGGKLLKRTI